MPKAFLAIPWQRMATSFLGADGQGPWLCAEPGVSLQHRCGCGQGPCRHLRRQPRHRLLDQERENQTGNLASETRRAGVTKAMGKVLLLVSLAACEGGHGVCSEKLRLRGFLVLAATGRAPWKPGQALFLSRSLRHSSVAVVCRQQARSYSRSSASSSG